MQIEIRNIHESYAFDLFDYLIFVGSNQVGKQRIFSLIDRYFASASYNEVEEEYFGDNGIEICIEGKKIRVNSCLFMSLSNVDDLLLQFKLTKKSLLYSSLCDLGQDIEVSQQMMHVNDELLKLEAMIGHKQSSVLGNIGYLISDLTFEDIIGKLMTTSYKKNNREIPSYLLDGEDMIDGFLKLVEQYMSITGKQVWISINNPENFLSVEGTHRLIEGLKNLARISKQLYFFVFHQRNNRLYGVEDIHHTVVCASDIQQLPDFETFLQSVERNYPGNYQFDSEELAESFYRICSEIGVNKSLKYPSMTRDVVLLKVICELLEEDIQFETSNNDISFLEQTYLLS